MKRKKCVPFLLIVCIGIMMIRAITLEAANLGAIVLDRTGSMLQIRPIDGITRWETAIQISLQDVDSYMVHPDDEMCVYYFSVVGGSRQIIRYLNPTSDKDAVRSAIIHIGISLLPSGSTNLADAMAEVATYIADTVPGSFDTKSVYLYTDGNENNSEPSLYHNRADLCDPLPLAGWDHDCDPTDWSTCSDYQDCLIFTLYKSFLESNAAFFPRYFGYTVSSYAAKTAVSEQYGQCGNNECEKNEDCKTCPRDCGPCDEEEKAKPDFPDLPWIEWLATRTGGNTKAINDRDQLFPALDWFPASGQLPHSAQFDLALTHEAKINNPNLRILFNGLDNTEEFFSHAIRGKSNTGKITYRIPYASKYLKPGTQEIIAIMNPANKYGYSVSDTTVLEIFEVKESKLLKNSGASGKNIFKTDPHKVIQVIK